MAAMYLHSACPEGAQTADEQVCRELMEDLLAAGNFGRKDQQRMRAGNMLPEYGQEKGKKGKLAMLFHTLRQSSVRLKPALEHKPVRLFFYMSYRVLRYMLLFLSGKRANLLKSADYADERRSIYDRLHMFETE